MDAQGARSITGGAMLPYDDNFDLKSDKWLVQGVNDALLHDLVDPYDIGRTVLMSYTTGSKQAHVDAHLNDVYTAADQPSSLGTFLSGAAFAVFAVPSQFTSVLTGMQAVRDAVGIGAEYVFDGRNVIFGSNSGSSLSVNNGRGDLYESGLKTIFVGGEGDDVVALKGGDKVYANSGDDTIIVNHLGDMSNFAYADIYTAAGSDTLIYSNLDGWTRAKHMDQWFDADANDKIVFNNEYVTGGSRVMYLFGYEYEDGPISVVNPEEPTITANDDVAFVRKATSPSELSVYFLGGNAVNLHGYTDGKAGLSIPVIENAFYQEGSTAPAAVFSIEGSVYYAGIHDAYIEETGPIG